MAARSAEVAGDPVVRVEALALVARCYFLEDNLADGRSWLEERAEGLAQASEPLGWSRCRQVRGILTRAEGNTDKALEIFEGLYDFCREKGLYERALDAAHHLALLAPSTARSSGPSGRSRLPKPGATNPFSRSFGTTLG
ncbi:MAG: hypothetical protein R3E96_05230 [Planctomycetota bacterium]